MRALILVLLVGCGSTAEQSCPANLQDGDACGFVQRCWRENTFSSCASGWCRCEAGRIACDGISNGAPCGDEPIDSCSVEGNPSCTTLPTGGGCGCDADGTWHCYCACYGGRTTCEVDPCTLSQQRLAGAMCSDMGKVCNYPGGVSCTCMEPAPGSTMEFICQ